MEDDGSQCTTTLSNPDLFTYNCHRPAHPASRCLLAAGNILAVMLLHVVSGIVGHWKLCFHVCVRRVSDAENLSVFLVSEGELLCLLNPSDKTYVKMSVTHTFIDVFILSCHICIFMFGIFSSLKALKLHSTCFLSCCVLIQVQKRKAAFCQPACQFSHQWLAHNFKTQTMANIQAWRGTAH